MKRTGKICVVLVLLMAAVALVLLPGNEGVSSDHLRTVKTEEGDRTVSFIRELEESERPAEIARIMGSAPGDAAALDHARSLLEAAGKQIQENG